MNRQKCIDQIIKSMQLSEYYESNRGTNVSYDELVDDNLEALQYLEENLK